MSISDEVIIRLAGHLDEHDKQFAELIEAIESLQRNLTNAFKEAGYDFQKIARIESSRRRDAIQNNTVVELDPDEYADPDFQDEVARKILASQPLTSNEDLIKMQQEQPYGSGPQRDISQEQPEQIGPGHDGDTRDPRARLTDASNKGRKE